MRRYCVPFALVLAGLCLWPGPTNAAPNDWNGAWIGYVCPPRSGVSPARCASFFLRLYSRNAKVCGSHVFATAGARELDEGGIPSVLAQVSHKTANGTVETTRASPSSRLPVSMELGENELRWQRTETPKGNYLLPRTLMLTRSTQGSMLSPDFEQRLLAACSTYLDMPADKATTTTR